MIILDSCKFGTKQETQRLPNPRDSYSDSSKTTTTEEYALYLDSVNKDPKHLAFLDSLRKDSISVNLAVRNNPTNFVVYGKRAFYEFNHGNTQDALSDYQKVLELNPQDSNANFNLGRIELNLQDYRGTRKNYLVSTQINPHNADAFYFLGLSEINLYRSKSEENVDKSELKESACHHLSLAGQLGNRKAYEEIKSFCNKAD